MKKGIKVTLKQPCGYEVCKYNPRYMQGVVIGQNPKKHFNPIIVEWANGIRNSYTENQLIEI
jgi:hypothetical protein